MPSDVVEQVEQRKRLVEEDKNHHQQREVIKKTSQDVQVHQSRKAASRGCDDLQWVSVGSAGCGRPCARLCLAAAPQANPDLDVSEWPQPSAFTAKLFQDRKSVV